MKRSAQKATSKQTKAYNTRLVLRTIYDHDRISRADIARATGLTRPTVSDAVAGLSRRGLVEEVGQGPSAGGKPPILLSVIDDSRHAIGIDLASDEFRGAVVNRRGEIRHRASLPLDGRDGEVALERVYELVDHLLSATGSPLLGIGIGTPGLMDPTKGIVRRAVNLDWQDLPLRSLLKQRYGLPLYLANDPQVAALAGADCKHQVDLPRSLQPWRTEKKAAVRQGLGPHGAAVRGNVDRRLDHRRVVGKAVEVERDLLAVEHADELVALVRSLGDFSVGVAAFPEVHPRSTDRATDRRFLAAKLEAADFGMTQFFWEAEHYRTMIEELGALGCMTPILPLSLIHI